MAHLSHIVPSQPPRNPTTHWRRHQRRNNPAANQRWRQQQCGQTSSQPPGPSRPRLPASRDVLSQPAPSQHGAVSVSSSQPLPNDPPPQSSGSHPPTDECIRLCFARPVMVHDEPPPGAHPLHRPLQVHLRWQLPACEVQ